MLLAELQLARARIRDIQLLSRQLVTVASNRHLEGQPVNRDNRCSRFAAYRIEQVFKTPVTVDQRHLSTSILSHLDSDPCQNYSVCTTTSSTRTITSQCVAQLWVRWRSPLGHTLLPIAKGYNHPHNQRAALLHTSPWWMEEEKSVLEKAVDTLKEKKSKKSLLKQPVVSASSAEVKPTKPSIFTRIKDTALHTYHGFRLFFLDLRISSRLLLKTLRGQSLSRREHKQFRRTAGDLFRIVPFSVFIIIPFMEFLLPVYLWVFPSALPSTFQSELSREARKKQQLKVKLQMAKFLQDTVEEMAITSSNPNKQEAVQEFANFFQRIRTSAAQATTEEIVKFSKLFENDLTLDNLTRPQLVALCRLLLLQPIGSSNFLRFQLRMKLRQLMADDKMIVKEGLASLTVAELQAASQARGMRAIGMPEDILRFQLEQWLELHMNKKVPTSLLLLSRALYLPADIPAPEALKATLSTLPENIVEEAEVLVASTAGEPVDSKTLADVIQQQEIFIKEEEKEKVEEKKEKEQKDTARSITTDHTLPADEEKFSVEELRDLSQAVSSLKGSLEEDLREIREDREEYREDVADLVEECQGESEALKESTASVRLGRRVEAMLTKIDHTLHKVESDFVANKASHSSVKVLEEHEGTTITVQQLQEALRALKGTSGDAKFRSLISVLDEDHDGNMNLDEIAEVIELLGHEDTDISPEHIAQIKELVKLELEEKKNLKFK